MHARRPPREHLVSPFTGGIPIQPLNQFWGTYKGYKQSYLMDNQVRERFYYPKGFVVKDKQQDDSHRRIDYSNLDQPKEHINTDQ